MARDRVYTVSDFYDHPLGGVADYRSEPHVYERQFSESDDEWSDLFWLMQIDRPLALALEQSAIYGRWVSQWKKGELPLRSHPYLPKDRERYEELQRSIGDRLRARRELSVIQRGVFSYDVASGVWFVEWTNP